MAGGSLTSRNHAEMEYCHTGCSVRIDTKARSKCAPVSLCLVYRHFRMMLTCMNGRNLPALVRQKEPDRSWRGRQLFCSPDRNYMLCEMLHSPMPGSTCCSTIGKPAWCPVFFYDFSTHHRSAAVPPDSFCAVARTVHRDYLHAGGSALLHPCPARRGDGRL